MKTEKCCIAFNDVPKVPTTPFFFFFCEQERGREGEGSFLFFSKWFSSRQLGFWCSFPNKRKTINNKISLGQFIVYWQFFDLEEGPERVKIFSRKIFALEVGLGQEELQGIYLHFRRLPNGTPY